MIKSKRIFFLSIAASLMLISNSNAQDQSMIAYNAPAEITYNRTSNTETTAQPITPLLESKQFTYKYQGNDVLVIFSKTEHVEYFNNKEHYIKSKVSWTSEDECVMILQESNLPRFPFIKGDKLNMKITKVKRGYIHYESTLAGRTWTGKMKQQ